MAKKTRGKTFWQHIRFKYKLSILNEKTLEEAWAFRLSLLSAIWAGLALFAVAVFLVSTLIVYTPIKNFLPGYLDVNARKDIINNALKLDSLENLIQTQEKYLTSVKSVLKGDIKLDSISTIDSLTNIKPDELKASKGELNFRKEYEEEEKFNLSIQPKQINRMESVDFIRPVKGVITKKFNPAQKQFGISVTTKPDSPVMAALEGDVILCGRLENGTEFIQILHPEGYVSIYKNCSRVLKNPGESVRTGEAIATTAPLSGNKTALPVVIELWHNGKPVNPTQYIVF